MFAKILIDNISKNEWRSEWGLAVYVEYGGHRFLLDAGTTGAFADNARDMGIDLGAVEYGILSHAHFDHSDGLERFFKENRNAEFYLRKGTMENCYKLETPFDSRYIGIHEGYLERFSDRIRYVDGDYEIVPGAVLLPHKTPGLNKVGEKAKMYVKINGKFRPDDFSHEQSLVFDTEQGLVIFNSCSHGGADTIIREVEKTYPGKKIAALIGGLHLFESSDEDILSLAQRIRDTGIGKVYTGHCTGDHAMELLKEQLGDRAEQIYTGLEIRI